MYFKKLNNCSKWLNFRWLSKRIPKIKQLGLRPGAQAEAVSGQVLSLPLRHRDDEPIPDISTNRRCFETFILRSDLLIWRARGGSHLEVILPINEFEILKWRNLKEITRRTCLFKLFFCFVQADFSSSTFSTISF